LGSAACPTVIGKGTELGADHPAVALDPGFVAYPSACRPTSARRSGFILAGQAFDP
jgi:hypothetical protein